MGWPHVRWDGTLRTVSVEFVVFSNVFVTTKPTFHPHPHPIPITGLLSYFPSTYSPFGRVENIPAHLPLLQVRPLVFASSRIVAQKAHKASYKTSSKARGLLKRLTGPFTAAF